MRGESSPRSGATWGSLLFLWTGHPEARHRAPSVEEPSGRKNPSYGVISNTVPFVW